MKRRAPAHCNQRKALVATKRAQPKINEYMKLKNKLSKTCSDINWSNIFLDQSPKAKEMKKKKKKNQQPANGTKSTL